MSKRTLSNVTRRPRNTGRHRSTKYKDLLNEMLEHKNRVLEMLMATETLEDYEILVTDYHKTLNLIQRCKGSMKTSLRGNQ